jgi:iron complex outermembrane receptor protein
MTSRLTVIMRPSLPNPIVWLACMPLAALAQVPTLPPVIVTAPGHSSTNATLGSTDLNKSDIAPKRAATSDTAHLLQDIPGVSLFGAGGISSLPVIHGMADERLNVQVNGMGLMPSCPNHMNSPLSYIDPTSVDSIKVYVGVTPVSVGGDSIGGSIQVKSAPPKFAKNGEEPLVAGEVGAFFRSNGAALGSNVSATIATKDLNLTYTASSVRSENVHAAQGFHSAGYGRSGGHWLDDDEVGSSAYRAVNQNMGIALRLDNHLVQLNVGQQSVPYEGFPNQRMDLTENVATIVNLGYKGVFEWGDLEARLYSQRITHAMNMGPDRMMDIFPGMPMYTKGKVLGSKLQANILFSERDTFRVGIESQNYTMYDWWTPVGGQMGPNALWNIDYGTRNKIGTFGEWEATWNPRWISLLGLRGDVVRSDAGPVQGYNGSPVWAEDAAAFNARDRQRTFNALDLTALVRYEPAATNSFELGYARKSRAPSLYQLYPWSTYEMATTMNNFAGDGGGYTGNLNLKEEVAHTWSTSGDWHDETKKQWGLKATAYFTHIDNYISAKRCNISYCDPNKLTTTTGFVALQHANQTAEIYGLDLSGHGVLGEHSTYGSFTATGVMSYLRGKETSTGDNLFNMMPLNIRMAVTQRLGRWANTAEVQLVAAKTNVSQVRNEVQTAGYALLNLRSSAQLMKKIRLDVGIENALNHDYQQPLGGAYVGQGNAMFLDSLHWGDYVPGMGRSANAALNVSF